MKQEWLGWILASCVVLGLYDVCKKASVRGNAVFPTLLGSTLAGWTAVTAFLVCRGGFAAAIELPAAHVALLLVKSAIVGASWTATYMALRTLPITCAAPIRATGPLWTLVGAIAVFGEVPTPVQAVGMATVVAGCVLFSWSAAREGIDFRRDRAVLLAFLGTVLGSCSALYDKHLLKGLGIPTGAVLWWFMGGMCAIYGVAAALPPVLSRLRRWCLRGGAAGACAAEPLVPGVAFSWRWTIPLVGVLLALSDACYFNAVSAPGARISVLSMVRRSSVVIAFLLGGAVFHETNLLRKALALAAILAGVAVLCLC